jgi:outer membrane biosynthesis protein TonB
VTTPVPPPNNATSTATQTSAPLPVPSVVAVPIVVQQQQQQQQQQQPVAVPVPVAPVFASGRSSLPQTGSNTGEMAQGGTGALIIGVSLIEFARRRKRRFATASVSSSTTEGDLFLPFWPR